MWLILKTDHAKEQYVARQVAGLGYDAWVPSQIIVTRKCAGRRVMAQSNAQQIKELPILPRRVFVQMPFGVDTEALQADVARVRYSAGLERDMASSALVIPSVQIAAFRSAIDAENTASLALAQKASRRQKARWKSLHDALVEMIQGAKQQLEQAA